MGTRKEDTREHVAGMESYSVPQTTFSSPIHFPSQRGAPITQPKYKVVIAGHELAVQITSLTIYADFELVVKQLFEEYSMKK